MSVAAVDPGCGFLSLGEAPVACPPSNGAAANGAAANGTAANGAATNGAATNGAHDSADVLPQIERAIVQSHGHPVTLSMPLMLAVNEGKLIVNAPAGKVGADRAEVWLCPTSKLVPVAITRGENKGRSITYHNVVRRWIKIGEWNGAAGTWTVPLSDFQTDVIDQVAVIVQSGTAAAPGPMVAAGKLALR